MRFLKQVTMFSVVAIIMSACGESSDSSSETQNRALKGGAIQGNHVATTNDYNHRWVPGRYLANRFP